MPSFPSQQRTRHSVHNMSIHQKYRRISITPSAKSLNSAFTMLMNILKQPSLGLYVRHIKYDRSPINGREHVEEDYRQRMSAAETWLLRAATRKAGFAGEHEDIMMDMLIQNTSEEEAGWDNRRLDKIREVCLAQALAALLITVSPYIESIAMIPPFGFYRETYYFLEPGTIPPFLPLDMLFRQVNANPAESPFLQNLRDVYLINRSEGGIDDDRFYRDMDLVGCFPLFHQLPSIESVRTDVLEEDENPLPGVEADSSNVSQIAIHHSSVDIFYLVSVISWCKVLRQFEYSIGGRSSLIGGNSFFNPKTFILYLLRHTQTLEVLDIDVETHISEFTHEHNEHPDFERHGGQADLLELAEFNCSIMVPPESFWKQNASLRDFESLRRLSIGVNFLVYFARGVNATRNSSPGFCLVGSLPPNLEYLCIRGYERGKKEILDAQLDALMASVKAGSLKLRVTGVDELIPNAEDVVDRDEESDLLWDFEGDDWFEDK